MIKLIAFFKRRSDFEIEAFHEYWRTKHAELASRLPGLRRYVQNHTLHSVYRTREPVYDAVAEAWFEDMAALRDLPESAAYAAVREDEPKFIDLETLGSIVTTDHIVTDGPADPNAVKNIAFLHRREGLSVDAFQRYWREIHGPIAAEIPGSRRYVQSHTLPASYRGPEAPLYDGVPFAWFDDTDAMRVSARSEAYARTRADEANFLSPGPLPFLIAREHRVL